MAEEESTREHRAGEERELTPEQAVESLRLLEHIEQMAFFIMVVLGGLFGLVLGGLLGALYAMEKK